LCHGPLTNQWYKLTPTSSGSYQQGTWTSIAPMQADYGPLYYASSVLSDGRVVVIGGEYNLDQGGVWTAKGAIYNPVSDKWNFLPPPTGWSNIGDAQCNVMPDGTFLLANLFDTRMASLNPKTLVWTEHPGTGKLDRQDEEGWVLLPDGSILTLDAINAPHAERYIPSLDKWISAGDTPQSLADASSQELGPMLLMPDGKVFAFGATGHNAIYTPGTNASDPGTWTAAPDFPNIGGQLDIADGPAVLLPNGKLLAYASPGVFNSPSHFYEWDGTALLEVSNVPNSSNNPSFVGNFLVLPNGQVMFTDFSRDVEFYTPGGAPKDSWRPTISSVPTVLNLGKTAVVKGTQLNGLSAGSAYGDDSTNNTNYPLVRVTYKTSHHVTFFRTHDHSTMAVATGSKQVSTNFDIPINAETGKATLEVVVNGISSLPVDVTVTKDSLKADSVGMFEGSGSSGSLASILASDDNYFTVNSTLISGTGQVASAYATFTIPGGSASSLQYSFESSTTVSLQVLFFGYNYTTGKYDNFGATSQTTTDKITTFQIPNAANYIGPGGVTKVMIRAVNPSRANRSAVPMTLKLDQVTFVPG
ncbi:MAG: kelch repeat-containing protein, partial [Armatimonadota bacterium]